VLLEVRQLNERRRAQQAFEGLLACVQAHVQPKDRRVREGYVAGGATVRLEPGVAPHVNHQLRALDEPRTALGALVRFVHDVRAQMRQYVAFESFVADGTAEGAFVVVDTSQVLE